MSERSIPNSSRRAVLLACGTGFAALAGCTGVELNGDETREYDVGRLSDIARKDVPTRPDAFPVPVTGLLDRHYDRARELISTVPERPTVPNDVVTKQLRDDRQHVIDALERRPPDEERALRRLSSARHVRGNAAEVVGAFRAATRDIDPDALAERRAMLRADLRSFESGWEYRGDTPARALVVHATLEDLRGDVRRNAEAWPPIPTDPTDDPFQVGRHVSNLETGRAALSDADQLQSTFLEGVDDSESYRTAITAAAHRLADRVLWDRRWAHDYLDARAAEPPFERSIDDTPALHLFAEAQRESDGALEVAERALQRGELASATLLNARALASLRVLETIVDAIQRGEYGPPADTDVAASARQEALNAVDQALETMPPAVSAELIAPAFDALHHAHDALEYADGTGREVDESLAMFIYARRYATTVPGIVTLVVESLADGR